MVGYATRGGIGVKRCFTLDRFYRRIRNEGGGRYLGVGDDTRGLLILVLAFIGFVSLLVWAQMRSSAKNQEQLEKIVR